MRQRYVVRQTIYNDRDKNNDLKERDAEDWMNSTDEDNRPFLKASN